MYFVAGCQQSLVFSQACYLSLFGYCQASPDFDVKFIIWLDMSENLVIKMLPNELIILCVSFLF